MTSAVTPEGRGLGERTPRGRRAPASASRGAGPVEEMVPTIQPSAEPIATIAMGATGLGHPVAK